MSTRSTTHFGYGLGEKWMTRAIIRIQGDGYPEGVGTDIYRFLAEVKATLSDTRLDDPTSLAAKYVVWLARKFAVDDDCVDGKIIETPSASPLDFLSVGVMVKDPTDIVFRYHVNCKNIGEDGFPEVTCIHVDDGVKCEIPRPDA